MDLATRQLGFIYFQSFAIDAAKKVGTQHESASFLVLFLTKRSYIHLADIAENNFF